MKTKKIHTPSRCVAGEAADDARRSDEHQAPGRGHIPTYLSKHEMELSRPAWANFEMENAYWERLESISEAEKCSLADIAERAHNEYPELAMDVAVRLLIVVYFRHRSRFLPIGRQFPVRSLHEGSAALS